jgi:hypothetical protein
MLLQRGSKQASITHEYEDFLLNPLPKKELQNQQYHMGLKAHLRWDNE